MYIYTSIYIYTCTPGPNVIGTWYDIAVSFTFPWFSLIFELIRWIRYIFAYTCVYIHNIYIYICIYTCNYIYVMHIYIY